MSMDLIKNINYRQNTPNLQFQQNANKKTNIQETKNQPAKDSSQAVTSYGKAKINIENSSSPAASQISFNGYEKEGSRLEGYILEKEGDIFEACGMERSKNSSIIAAIIELSAQKPGWQKINKYYKYGPGIIHLIYKNNNSSTFVDSSGCIYSGKKADSDSSPVLSQELQEEGDVEAYNITHDD